MTLPLLTSTTWRLLTKEHEIEEIFWWHELILEVSMTETMSMMATTATTTWVWFLPLKGIHTPKLVVLATFLWIRKACHCCIHFLERFTSLRSIVFVWVDFNCFLAICFFQCVIICISLDSKHLVVIFAAQYFLCNWSLLRCKFLGRLLCFDFRCLLSFSFFFLFLSSLLGLLLRNHV